MRNPDIIGFHSLMAVFAGVEFPRYEVA